MFADTTIIRALARRLRERADEIRDLAADLTTRAAAVPWSGLAADAMRAHAAVQAAALLRTAGLHDDAAEALARHAAAVDQRLDLLAATAGAAGELAGDVADGIADAAKGLLP